MKGGTKMALVENNVVKMDWDKAGWLQTKGSAGKQGAFILASKEFPSTTKGTVTVFFNPFTAFMWISDAHTSEEDMWNASELKEWLKSELDGSFPDNYDECVNIIPYGNLEADVAVLEEYGILDYKDEIEARLRDVAPYGDEKEMSR